MFVYLFSIQAPQRMNPTDWMSLFVLMVAIMRYLHVSFSTLFTSKHQKLWRRTQPCYLVTLMSVLSCDEAEPDGAFSFLQSCWGTDKRLIKVREILWSAVKYGDMWLNSHACKPVMQARHTAEQNYGEFMRDVWKLIKIFRGFCFFFFFSICYGFTCTNPTKI